MRDYEYGIWSDYYDEIHREGFTEKEALTWIEEWVEDGGEPTAFRVVRRPISFWEEIF